VAYVCALAYAEPGAEPRVFTERCEGELAYEPRGDGGFGYDPAFVPADRDDGRTMAELSVAEKDTISHRGRAARAFLDWLGARA
jgi:XTP/dITP diphosphohydrolase